jgi:tetratricopeptide (TPR) repeat protein
MAGALADRATCLLFSGQRAAALPDYERATELAPDWSWVARAYSKELYISLRPQDAAAVLERFLAAHPRDPDALEDLGLIYRQTLHQPDHARELMERLIEIEPKRAAAWRIYGDALFDLHDPRTRATYEHYFELVDPKDPIESKIAPFYQRKLPYAPPAEIAH